MSTNEERSLARAKHLASNSGLEILKAAAGVVPGGSTVVSLSENLRAWQLQLAAERLRRVATRLLSAPPEEGVTDEALESIEPSLWPFVLEKVAEDTEAEKDEAYASLCRWLAQEKPSAEIAREVVRAVAKLQKSDLCLLLHLASLTPGGDEPAGGRIPEPLSPEESLYQLRLGRLAESGCLVRFGYRAAGVVSFTTSPVGEFGHLVCAAVKGLEPEAPGIYFE